MSDFFYPIFNAKSLCEHLAHETDFIIEHNGDDYVANKVKVSRQIYRAKMLVCIDIAIITYNGIFHIDFLPGADSNDVRIVTETMAQYKG